MHDGRAHNVLVTGELTPGMYGSTFGIATHGKNLATFDNSYWTDTKAEKVALAVKNSTDSNLVTSHTYDEQERLLNNTVAVIAGLKKWIIQDEVLKPIGTVSDGNAKVDKSALHLIIEKEKNYVASDYTSFSWDQLQDVLTNVKKSLESPEVPQYKIDQLVIQFNKAVDELITAKNYELLKLEINKTDEIMTNYQDYTKESYDEVYKKRTLAISVKKKVESSTNQNITDIAVLEAYNELANAIKNLVKRPWINITTAEELSSIEGDKQYILTSDITDYEGNINTLTGKLDGNGHTISFATDAKPLFHTIAKDAEVRNLGLTGKVTGGGAFAEILSGTVRNSYSWADVDNGDQVAGGVAGISPQQATGNIINMYVTGTVTSTKSAGALLGSSGSSTFFSNSYHAQNIDAIGTGTDEVVAIQKSIEEMQEESFARSLNENKGRNHLQWNRNEDGLPYFGIEAAPVESFLPVVMTSLVDLPSQTIKKSGDVLTTSIFGQDDGFVAQLAIPDYNKTIQWETTSKEANSPVIVSRSSGEVFVRAPGTVTVTAIDHSTNKSIQSFTLTAEVPDTFDITLQIDGENQSGKTQHTPGSESFAIRPVVTVNDGNPLHVLPSLFTWTSDDRSVIRVYSDGYVEPVKVGAATITASLENKSEKVTIVAGYTAIQTIEPSFKGTYYIHGRSPNSIGQNDTPGIASFSPLRNSADGGLIIGSEFLIANVNPKNATYAKNYTVATDKPDILVYKGSMLNSLLPIKEGTVQLTVTSNDPQADPKPSGTSEVTIKYFNPLERLAVENDTLTVKKGEVIDAGLIFTGPKSVDGYHVTESMMTWKQTGTGEVLPYRNYPVIMVGDDGASTKEGVVSNDQWLLRGVKEGDVTLTGTPVDNANGAQAITLNIRVVAGEDVIEQPANELVSEILKKTIDYQVNQIGAPTFGDEWTILGFARAGYEAPADFYETYYAAVYNKVRAEAALPSKRYDDKVTEVQRLALALTAIGKDPRNVNGVDLLDYSWNKEKNFPNMTPNGILGHRQGSNELIFALLAVDAHKDFKQPSDATISTDEMITRLLDEYQTTDGGFGLSDNKTSSTDMTAMAIQALAKHQDKPKVKEAINRALEKLSIMQGIDGSYGTSESTSQVLVALAELAIDPHTDPRFIKSGSSVLDGQMTYAKKDGSFSHSIGGQGNVIATDQALYALAALERFYAGANSLYDMNDVVFAHTGAPEVTSISISPSTSQLNTGKSMQLKATVLPVEANDQSVTWTSDNESIATVTSDGVVKGITAGTATITVETNSGNHTATAIITVVNPAPPTKPEAKKTVTLSVEKQTIGEGNIISSTATTIEKGDTAFTVLKRLLDTKGISISYIGSGSSLYVQAIDNLGEFDHGQSSGWMYSVNGVFPEFSAGLYALQDGDVLRWRYTKNLGADLTNPPPTKPDPKPDPKPEPQPKPDPKPETPLAVEAPNNVETVIKDNKIEIQIKDETTGVLSPAPIESSEVVGGFLIVQIGSKGQALPEGLKLPEGSKTKVVVLDNDKPYDYFDTASNTKPNKEWNITFSGALLDDAENLKKVQVQNAAGETVDMKVKLSPDGKSLIIIPNADYQKGELYYITISGVVSASGKTLKQDIRKIFIVE